MSDYATEKLYEARRECLLTMRKHEADAASARQKANDCERLAAVKREHLRAVENSIEVLAPGTLNVSDDLDLPGTIDGQIAPWPEG